MSYSKASDYKSAFNQLETVFDEYLGQKAPLLPDNIKEVIVSIAPYLSIICIVISLPAILAILGIGAMLGPFSTLMGASYMMSYGIMYYIGVAAIIVSAVLNGLAINGLFKHSLSAWRLMYYSSLISFVASVLQGSVLGAFIGGLISLYILFQVKSKYK